MKQEYKDKIKHEIESEGFIYTFTDLGDWKHIKDEKFHKLRSTFVKAFEKFSDYLASIGAYPTDEEDDTDEEVFLPIKPLSKKQKELALLKHDYSWICAFNEAYGAGYTGSNFSPYLDNVVEIIACSEGENDGPNWIGIFKMKDKTYVKVFAGCDYTGWDCQAGGGYEVYKTLKEACSKTTLTEQERIRLYSQLKEKKIKLDWSLNGL